MKQKSDEACLTCNYVKNLPIGRATLPEHQEPSGSPEHATRTRLLAEAEKLFAAKGRAATVRDICSAAEANTSSINYHFGSKELLLAEILKNILERNLTDYPLDGGMPQTAPPEERLFGFVLSLLSRMLLYKSMHGDEDKIPDLLMEAFINPAGPFEPYVRSHRKAHTAFLLPLLHELTAEKMDEEHLKAGATILLRSIFGQILFYGTHYNSLMFQRNDAKFTEPEVFAIARQITTFSIGGIQAYEPHHTLTTVLPCFETFPPAD